MRQDVLKIITRQFYVRVNWAFAANSSTHRNYQNQIRQNQYQHRHLV